MNRDCLSNAGRSGESTNLKTGPLGVRIVICRGCFGSGPHLSALERAVIEGENPVWDGWSRPCEAPSKIRVVWECSSKRVVNFIES